MRDDLGVRHVPSDDLFAVAADHSGELDIRHSLGELVQDLSALVGVEVDQRHQVARGGGVLGGPDRRVHDDAGHPVAGALALYP
ncbi:hypothetical protein [Streptomyces iranensis]|uniref:hypothetical protein n=1 Tax=Streptomyces iranensis TaxID=576784 RepID=UPI0039B73865